MATIVRELLDEEASADLLAKSSVADQTKDTPTTYAKAIVQVTIRKALKGDMRAIIWLTEQQNISGVRDEVLRREPIVVSHLKPRY